MMSAFNRSEVHRWIHENYPNNMRLFSPVSESVVDYIIRGIAILFGWTGLAPKIIPRNLTTWFLFNDELGKYYRNYYQ